MKHVSYFKTVMGDIGIADNGEAVTHVFFGKKGGPADAQRQETALILETAAQLAEYFAGERKTFSVPLAPDGTAYQKRVWDALLTIPYGETRSYGQLAAQMGEGGARSAGGANSRNPIWIIIPCHRVIGASGKLTGYAGGVDMKERLLALEKQHRECR